MKIHFESSGGVAGPAGRRSCVVESNELPPHLVAVVASITGGDFQPEPSLVERPDEVYIDITVEDGGHRTTLSVPRRQLAADMRPLVQWLEQRCL